MVRIPVTQPQAARAGGWLSLVVIIGHSVLAYMVFGGSAFPIHIDPFIRWELLNIEFCFTLLVILNAYLAIRHARWRQPDVRTPRAATTALALLWTGDAIFIALFPMPLPDELRWVRVVLPLAIGVLALVCWFAALAQQEAHAEVAFADVPTGLPRLRD